MNRAGMLAEPLEVRSILIASARARRPVTYSEVLQLLGHHFTRPKMRALCKVLARVDDDAFARDEPELAVLVVRQSDGLPGQGWWVAASRKHNFARSWDGPAAKKLVKKIQKQAFDYWAGRGD